MQPQQQQQQQPQQTSILPPKVVTQPVIRQTVGAPPPTIYTESQINDFVSKCRTFLTTLLRLAEKQAPEKLPMVRTCIQELLVKRFYFFHPLSNLRSSIDSSRSGRNDRSRIVYSTAPYVVQISATHISGAVLQGNCSTALDIYRKRRANQRYLASAEKLTDFFCRVSTS